MDGINEYKFLFLLLKMFSALKILILKTHKQRFVSVLKTSLTFSYFDVLMAIFRALYELTNKQKKSGQAHIQREGEGEKSYSIAYN